MIAIVFGREASQIEAVEPLLREIGYAAVYHLHQWSDIEQEVIRNRERRAVIIGFENTGDSSALQLLTPPPELDSVPRILVRNSGLLGRLLNQVLPQAEALGVDAILPAPFGKHNLLAAITRANRARALHRNALIWAGTRPLPAHLLGSESTQGHWKLIAQTPTASQLLESISDLGSRIGGILVDPQDQDPKMQEAVARYKKSALGISTPIACLSRDPSLIRDFRTVIDLFPQQDLAGRVPDPELIQGLLRQLSVRLQLDWQARRTGILARKAMRLNHYAHATSLIQQVLKHDRTRWELHELCGEISALNHRKAQAASYWRRALSHNPCAPYPYLRLMQSTEGAAKDFLARTALEYCPAHPEVREIAQ